MPSRQQNPRRPRTIQFDTDDCRHQGCSECGNDKFFVTAMLVEPPYLYRADLGPLYTLQYFTCSDPECGKLHGVDDLIWVEAKNKPQAPDDELTKEVAFK